MPASRDVIIIGAGPAGSSLAAALVDRGWDVLLVERDHLPRHKVCGEFLSPEAQVSLRNLDLFEAVAALHPCAVSAATIVTQSGIQFTTPLPGQAWGISRFAMDAALATVATRRGVELWANATVRSFAEDAQGYTVRVGRHNRIETVTTRTIIAAGGRHTQPGLPPRSRPLARRQRAIGVKAHYRGVTMPAAVELFFFPGGYVGINNIEDGRVNVCLLASYTSFAQAGKQVGAMLAMIAQWNPAFGARLGDGQIVHESIATVAPVDPYRPARPWDGIACVGDSAVMITPLCGDGMAMALRSAELCAPLADAYLLGRCSRAEWTAAYQRDWHAEFDRRLRLGRVLQRCLSRPWLANHLLRLGRTVPALAAYLVRATRS